MKNITIMTKGEIEMKLIKITQSTLLILILSTPGNANTNNKCIQAYGNVYGDKDSYGQSYEDFLKEQKSQKESLDFLVKHCKDSKYKAEEESLTSITKYLEKTTKISESDWNKEFKYP